MYQANQEVVNQNTNIALVNIRQTEINYFTSFFSSFGTQCFFLTAILAGSVSQTPSFDCASGCNYLWQFIYNVSVSISMSFTALCLLNSVFISIYGQGLAIRGETGSMINAMHGMIAEQARVVQMFVVGVITFQISTVAMFFVVMDWDWAIVCGIIALCASYYTYFSTVRIYNRFKWDFDRSGWNFDEANESDKVQRTLSFLTFNPFEDFLAKNESSSSNKPTNSPRKGILKSVQQPSSTNQIPAAETAKDKSAVTFDEISAHSQTPYIQMTDMKTSENQLVKGYVSLLMDTSSSTSKSYFPTSLMKTGPIWKRYFFVLKRSYLFYYNNERAYIHNPAQSINARPIDLEGYKVVQGQIDSTFEFHLVPTDPSDIRKIWKFRCETVKDYQYWMQNIQKVLNTFT